MNKPAEIPEEATIHNIFDSKECLDVLQKLILQLSFDGIKVSLEGLGILFTEKSEKSTSHVKSKETTLVKEDVYKLHFEKSYEISTFHYEKYGNIFETSELALRLKSRLPEHYSATLNLKSLSEELRKFFSTLRAEILTTGLCKKLDKLGTFIALKLSSSLNWRDNFGQADIVFLPHAKKTSRNEPAYKFQTPVLKSPWEPLEAFYEKYEERALNLLQSIKQLEIDPQDFKEQDLNKECKVAIFKAPSDMPDEDNFIYCTNGLVSTYQPEAKKRNIFELTMQTKVEHGAPTPLWPIKFISLIWLLQTINQKNCSASDLVNFDWSILAHRTNLQGILLTPCKALPGGYYGLSGKFHYLNVLGITKQESSFAHQYGPKTLLALLTAKEHHQITKLNRREIL